MTTEKLQFDVTADAKQAEQALKGVQKQVDALEKDKVEIPVDADTDQAIKAFKEVDKQAKKLTTGDHEITVQGKVDKVLGDLEKVAAEAKETQEAAEALGRALGPELTEKGDMTALVGELKKGGLALDEIKANAEQLAPKLKELADADVGGRLGASLGTARGKIDELGSSADSSKSVLANMVGNATQDIGALAGVAGSAGVAIGQMGEYIADAKAKGDSFGQILRGFGGVSLPLAGIALATQLISDHFKNIAESKAFNEKRVETFVAALKDAKVTANELADVLNEDKPSGIFARVDEETKNLDKSVFRTLGTFQKFQDTLNDPGGVDAYAQKLLDLNKTLDISATAHSDLKLAINAARDGEVDGITVTRARNAGMEDEVKTLIALGAARKTSTKGAEQAKFEEEFYATALEDTAEAEQEAADAAAEAAKKRSAAKASMDKYLLAVQHTTTAVEDMDSALSEIGRREGALSKVFELDTGPRGAAANVRDIGLAIDELSDKAKGVKVGDALANGIKADEFLDAIDALAPQIQEAVTTTFGSAGPEAATAMANSYIDQVTKELGGKFSREQVATMLGLDNITATINAAVNEEAAEQARQRLALLTGLTGESILTANLQVALDAGLLTPAQVQAVVDSVLRGQGVDVPATIGLTPEDAAAVDQWAKDHGVSIAANVEVVPPSTTAIAALVGGAVGAYSPPPVEVDLELDKKKADDDLKLFINKDRKTDPVVVTTDKIKADADMALFVGKPRTTEVDVTANTTPAVTSIVTDVTGKARSTEVDVGADVTEFNRDVGIARTNAAKPIVVHVKYVEDPHAKGGTVGPNGGVAGEAGAEFVQLPGRPTVLIDQKMIVPPGTKVTSVRKTREILSRKRPRYASGTAVPAARPAGGMSFTFNQQAPIYGVADLDRHLAAWSQRLAQQISAGRRS
jgi:hypothetical protein